MMNMNDIFSGLASVINGENIKALKTPCYIGGGIEALRTPCYVIDEKKLAVNGEILAGVASRTGCKILLAQKAFSNYDFYPLLSDYLAGTEASGLYEARLGKEEMPSGEVHVFCGAYRDDEFDELLKYADHIVFNSVTQLKKYGGRAKAGGKSVGLRINPECSTQDGHEIYDPCARGSRLGVTREVWDRDMTPDALALLDGIHFHTLCEQNSDALEVTLKAVEEKFGDVLPAMKWINMGGGHHITKGDYDVETLERVLVYARDKWGVQVYLEPGEAVALNAGYLLTRVLDIVENNGVKIAILDSSAACHMPDVIEMPYTPPLLDADASPILDAANSSLIDAGSEGAKAFCYRLGGPTCLSGDVIGEYSFDRELAVGDMLVFGDMAIYTTCKNNTFNGMQLPDIYRLKPDGVFEKLTEFGYRDFKYRLGKN